METKLLRLGIGCERDCCIEAAALGLLKGLPRGALYERIAEAAAETGVSKRRVWAALYGKKRKRAGRS